jgi:hypothetical protein
MCGACRKLDFDSEGLGGDRLAIALLFLAELAPAVD